MYIGVSANLPARVHQHRTVAGSSYCAVHHLTRLVWAEYAEDISDAIAHEKRVKRWLREWKFALIEKANPDWVDLYDQLAGGE
jgi:putative endonuclease